MKRLVRHIALVAAAAALTFTVGCGSSGNAYVKIIHASADAPNVDASVNGDLGFKNLAFGNATDYTKVPAGTSQKIEVFAAGSDSSPVITATGNLVKNQYYTVIALNKVASLQLAVENDDLTPPASGDVKIRVVHGSTLAGPVDVYVTAPGVNINDPSNPVTPVLSNFTFGTVTKYLQIPAGAYEVRVTPHGQPGTVAIDTGAKGVPLTAGNIYTAVALDPPNLDTTKPFSLLLTQDTPVPGVTPTAPTM